MSKLGDQKYETLKVGVYQCTFLSWETKEMGSYEDPNVMETKVSLRFEEPNSGCWVSALTSTARGPKSKLRPILLALNNGEELPKEIIEKGEKLEAFLTGKIGTSVLVNVGLSADGRFNRANNVMALPRGTATQPFKQTPAKDDDIPFFTDDPVDNANL